MAGCTGCITLVILLQIAAAIAIIVIIPLHLQQIQWDPTRFQGLKFWDGFVESNVCLLGTGFRNAHLCTYAIVAAGVSVGASLLISLMQVIFQGAGTAWWIVASIIVTKYARQANSLQYPQQDWRDTVMYLSWALAGLFAVGLCVSIGRSITVCCEGPCRRKVKAAPASTQFMTAPTPYAAYNGKVPTPSPHVPPGYVVRPAV